jgi:soluble lytic murein transglycosylase
MQVMPSTAKWLVDNDERLSPELHADLTNPMHSLRLGAFYLRRMLDRYDGNVIHALAAYNGGPGNCDKWRRNFRGSSQAEFIESIGFTETRNYVKRVLSNYMTYHSLYPPAGRPAASPE